MPDTYRRLIADIAAQIGRSPREAEKKDRQAEAEIERKTAEERERPEAKARREAAEEAKEAEEKEKREPPPALLSPQAPTPDLREQLEHVPSEQPETVAVRSTVPWRIIAGTAIIFGVIAIVVAVWRPGPPVTPQDASAMKDQGDRYYFGVNASKDDAKAREWYEKAADKGDASAKVRLQQLPIRKPPFSEYAVGTPALAALGREG
jgi:TPR repeat protein